MDHSIHAVTRQAIVATMRVPAAVFYRLILAAVWRWPKAPLFGPHRIAAFLPRMQIRDRTDFGSAVQCRFVVLAPAECVLIGVSLFVRRIVETRRRRPCGRDAVSRALHPPIAR